jgi:hypothetical protein
MSSNIRIERICEWCKKEFIARTTVTKCCSDSCSRSRIKSIKREDKIGRARLQTAIAKKPKDYVAEERMKAINAKELLTLQEAALFMSISDLTMRRWILTGKVVSRKAGKKHLILKADLLALSDCITS